MQRETRNAIKFITARAARREGRRLMRCCVLLLLSVPPQDRRGKGKKERRRGRIISWALLYQPDPAWRPRTAEWGSERVADHDNRITASATARKGGDLIGAKSVGEYPSIRPSLHSTPAECVKHPLEDRLDFRNLLHRRRPSETSSFFASHLPLSTRRLNQFKLEIDPEVLPFIARS